MWILYYIIYMYISTFLYFQSTLKVLKCHYMQMKFKSCFNMAGKNLLIFGKTPEIYSEHFLKSAVRNNKMKLKNFSSFSTPQGTQPNVWWDYHNGPTDLDYCTINGMYIFLFWPELNKTTSYFFSQNRSWNWKIFPPVSAKTDTGTSESIKMCILIKYQFQSLKQYYPKWSNVLDVKLRSMMSWVWYQVKSDELA